MKNIKKSIILFGAVVIALLMVSSITAVVGEQAELGTQNYEEKDEYLEYELELDANTMMIGELEDFIYSELTVIDPPNLDLLVIMVDNFFDAMDGLGINDETTVLQVCEIMSNNEEYMQANAGGTNLLCSADIVTGFDGGGIFSPFPPPSQIFRPSVFVLWSAHEGGSVVPGHVDIDGRYGRQEGIKGNDYNGILIGFLGTIISGFLNPVSQSADGFALISLSDVPFENGNSYGQGNLQSNPSGQPSSQTTEEQSTPSGTQGSSSPTSN